MNNNFHKMNRNNPFPFFAMGGSVVAAFAVSATLDNVEASSLTVAPEPVILSEFHNYRAFPALSSSSSDREQRVAAKARAPIMEQFKSEMDDFWMQVESGSFIYSADELAIAREIIQLHPNIQL